MSTETPEQTPAKSYHQSKREQVAAAITAWQKDESEANHPFCDADALMEILLDRGMQILPTASGYGRYLVLVDDQPTPYVGGTAPPRLMDADEAAETFLIAALGVEEADGEHTIVVRPATNAELYADLDADAPAPLADQGEAETR